MMASVTAATMTSGDLLFNCVTDVHTQAEDLEADLQCLDVRISRERQTHQSILDAKNALIDALYFKACRLEFASKKAIGILHRVYRQALLANAPLDLAESESGPLALPDKVIQAIALALRYLEVGQVPIEDDLEQTADAGQGVPHESILLNTYVSEDETESEALPVAPAPSVVACTKSTPKRNNPSHPPTPESLTQASPSSLPSVTPTPLATPNLNATPSRSILRSAKSQDLSEWTPSSHGDNSPSPIKFDQFPVTWKHDTPCKAVAALESRPKPLRVSFDTTEPSVAYSPRSSIYSVTSTIASPCQQCRKTEALFHAWQEERDTLRQGMEGLASRLEDTHGQLHHAELECLRLCQRLCAPHQSLRQFMLDQDLVHADGTPLTPTSPLKKPTANRASMTSLASPVPRSPPMPPSATSAASLHTLDALIDDFVQWINVLKASQLIATANPAAHGSQDSLPSMVVSQVAEDSHYSLLSTSTSASEYTYSVSSIDTLARSSLATGTPGSGMDHSNRLSCDSAIDPMSTHETLQSLIPLNANAVHKQPLAQAGPPSALKASQPLDNRPALNGQAGSSKTTSTCPVSPARTVHLDAITYTDFANFTLGLATYGAKEALLPDPSMLMSANNPWNALPLAFQVMEDDIKPCLFIPSATHASSPWASPKAKQNVPSATALAADDLLTAILSQKCDIISGQRSSSTNSSIQPSPTTSEASAEARETIILRGSAKRQVSLEGMPMLPASNQASTVAPSSVVPRSSSVSFVSHMAVCALCGQERECEYQLRIPAIQQHRSGTPTQGPGLAHGGHGGLFASSAMHHASAFGHASGPGSDQSRVANALGPLAKGWRALTTDLKWGKRGKFGNGYTAACGVPTAKVHPAHAPNSLHSSYNTSANTPPPAYHAHPIDRFCRDRIVTVCDLVGFLGHLSRGLWDHIPLINRYEKFVWHRQRINWARLGCLSILEPEELESELNTTVPPPQPHPRTATSSLTSCPLQPPPTGRFAPTMRASVATTTPAEVGSTRAGAPFHLLPPRPMQPASTVYRGSMVDSATRPNDPVALRQTRNRSLFVLRPQRSLPLMTAKPQAPTVGLPVPSHPLPTPLLPVPAQSTPPVNWKRSQLDDCQIVLVR
ncbi:hypothetical protein H4R35_000625 [Dimargaris xerosporica]|nr:hypothetical protein H4R35_000625 [Dimargaris xerosporica]